MQAVMTKTRLKTKNDSDTECHERVDVSCLVVYTDATYLAEAREKQLDRGFVRLLANDAHLLGKTLCTMDAWLATFFFSVVYV